VLHFKSNDLLNGEQRCHISLGQKITFSPFRRITDENIKKYKYVIEFYWSNNGQRHGIKGRNYDKYKNILKQENYLSSALEYPQLI